MVYISTLFVGCFSLTGVTDRSPALTVKSVAMSLISMLHSSPAKDRPPDDLRYSTACPASANPKHTRFIFDDNTV